MEYNKIYQTLNGIINIYPADEVIDSQIAKERIEHLLEKYVKEFNEYKNRVESSTMMLQAQFEEISRTYEELTTILDISKYIFAEKDPRNSIDKVISRMKDIINFRNVVIGEFIDYPAKPDFNILFAELSDTELDIMPLLEILKNNSFTKTILKESDDINNTKDSILLTPIKSQIKIWGFVLLYGKKDDSFFLASDRKIVEAVSEQLAFGFDAVHYFAEKIKQEKIEEQLKIARQIQEQLLPTKLPEFEYIESAAFYRSAFDVGGDYYDMIKINDHTAFAILADVSGKGIPAALIMSSLRGILISKIQSNSTIDEIVNYANNFLANNIPSDRFVTAFFMVIDTDKKEIKMVNAGHNPTPLFLDNVLHVVTADTMPLGILEESEYPVEVFNYNDEFSVCIYTDGLTEARNIDRDEFGYEKLEMLMKSIYNKNADVIVKSIIDTMDEFVQNAPQHDDTTMIIVKNK